jgi:CRP-like cAMP-binding protein
MGSRTGSIRGLRVSLLPAAAAQAQLYWLARTDRGSQMNLRAGTERLGLRTSDLRADHEISPSSNRLLSRLPDREMVRLLPLFERVVIAERQVVHHWNMPMEDVYFLERGLISVMAKINDQDWAEVWLIGSDGTTGIPIVLGETHPPHRRVVQIGGRALRISAVSFRHLLQMSEPFRELLFKYVQIVLLQTSQSGACNAQHSVKKRLARWLLLACDALGSRHVPLPQEMLGRLIGVRRATISDCLNDIEGCGAIRLSRRLIEITDSEALESLSCDCYRIIKRERQRLLGW